MNDHAPHPHHHMREDTQWRILHTMAEELQAQRRSLAVIVASQLLILAIVFISSVTNLIKWYAS